MGVEWQKTIGIMKITSHQVTNILLAAILLVLVSIAWRLHQDRPITAKRIHAAVEAGDVEVLEKLYLSMPTITIEKVNQTVDTDIQGTVDVDVQNTTLTVEIN